MLTCTRGIVVDLRGIDVDLRGIVVDLRGNCCGFACHARATRVGLM